MARQYTTVGLYIVCLVLLTSLTSTTVSLSLEEFSLEKEQLKKNNKVRFQEYADPTLRPRTDFDSSLAGKDDARLQALEQKVQNLDNQLLEQEKQCQTSCRDGLSNLEIKLMELQKLEQKIQHLETNKLIESQKFEQKIQHLENRLSELQKIEKKVHQLESKLPIFDFKTQHLETRLTVFLQQYQKKLAESEKLEQKVQHLENRLSELQKFEQKVQLLQLENKLAELQKIEKKIHQLESNMPIFDFKTQHLETRLTVFLQQYQTKLAELQKLEQNVQRLERKMLELQKLEQETQHLDTKLTGFLGQYNTSQNAISFTVKETAQLIGKHASKGSNFRTCQELHQSDRSLSSGMYWIDPDGYGFEDPIHVHCDMGTGKTSVPHDSENSTDVGRCVTPGCYSKLIKYSAPVRQMAALAELSDECHQSIRYDCNSAPFEINGVAQSWWNDRNGIAQYFWSGSNNNGHTCQCGIDRNCVKLPYKCNCDSAVSTSLSDIGVITDKGHLPITRLNFGRTQIATSSGIYKLGRFECTGQVNLGVMPKSCSDLWKIGHTATGIYSVMGSDYVESVYCDFAKRQDDQGFQMRIGYADVKSLPVYFYVQKDKSQEGDGIVTFELTRLNVGGAMNAKTGIFTAPRNGIYSFAFTGLGHFPTKSWNILRIDLMLNGVEVGRGATVSRDDGSFHTVSLHSTLELETGNQVWLRTIWLDGGAQLHDTNERLTHFTGHLLHEHVGSALESNIKGYRQHKNL